MTNGLCKTLLKPNYIGIPNKIQIARNRFAKIQNPNHLESPELCFYHDIIIIIIKAKNNIYTIFVIFGYHGEYV